MQALPPLHFNLTGHKDVASVMKYATASLDIQKDMSKIRVNDSNKEYDRPHITCIYSRTAHGVPVTSAVSMPISSIFSSNFSQSASAGEIFRNARLMNCQVILHHCGSIQSHLPKRKRIV